MPCPAATSTATDAPTTASPTTSSGESFDKVWEVNLGGQSSPPVVVETPRGLQVVVLVGTQVPQVRGYWALPRDPQGRIPPAGQEVWSVASPAPAAATPTTADGQIPAPIVIDNTLLLVPSLHQAGTQQSAGFYAVLLSDNPRCVRSSNVEPQRVVSATHGQRGQLAPACCGGLCAQLCARRQRYCGLLRHDARCGRHRHKPTGGRPSVLDWREGRGADPGDKQRGCLSGLPPLAHHRTRPLLCARRHQQPAPPARVPNRQRHRRD
jgi:hypothetical protein